MKSIISPIAILLGCLAATASGAIQVGDAVKVLRGSNYGSGGGVFNVDDLSEGGAVDFQTFCVEVDQHVSFGPSYYVSGVGNTNTSGNILGTEAAWLYTQFREGDISIGNTHEANAMQLGIWRGMGYGDADDILPAVTGFAYWNAGYITGTLDGILSAWLTTLAADYADWTSRGPDYVGGVQIMNLLTARGKAVQDQIIWSPVRDPAPDPTNLSNPEPATIVVWAGLAGLGLIGAARRSS